MAALLRVLVLDSDDSTRDVILKTLPLKDCELSFAATVEEAFGMLGSAHFTAAMIGSPLNGVSIQEFLTRAKNIDPRCELFIVTDEYRDEKAVDLITAGAFDVIEKPLEVKSLKKALFPFLMHKSQTEQVGELERQARALYQYQGMVGKNPQMMEIYSLVERVGRHFKAALVTGETGTGKGLVANALHRIAGGEPESYIYVNCPAMSATDFRSALLDPNSDQYIVERARGGTIFFDEIGEISAESQAIVIEAIEHGGFLNDGSIRIVASSARPLREMTASGSFRTELLARLSSVQISLPPLRDRQDDIPLICLHTLEKLRQAGRKTPKDFSREAMISLMKYQWPGNIRELEHVLERACVITDEEQVTLRDLPANVKGTGDASTDGDFDASLNLPNSLEDVERIHIAQVLKKADFNKVKAARMLGISRSTLYQKMAKYHLQDPTRQNASKESTSETPSPQAASTATDAQTMRSPATT